MKKYFAIVTALATAACAMASTVAEQGKSVNELIPDGWERVQSATGDVNHDGINDLVVMAFPNDEDKMFKRYDGYVINMNEPVVAVYMGQSDGSYRLYRQTNNIVPAQDEYNSIETFEVHVTAKGVINVVYSTFSSAGSWSNDTMTMTYRFQDGDLFLIGETTEGFDRASHDTEVYSINYLTGKACTTIKRNKGRSPKAKWENLGKKPLVPFGNSVVEE